MCIIVYVVDIITIQLQSSLYFHRGSGRMVVGWTSIGDPAIKRRIGIPLSGLIHLHIFVAVPNQVLDFHLNVITFIELRREVVVSFVNIVDHHYLNFLFIIYQLFID